MKKRKTLQDLTIRDNFMFGAAMSVEENCKGFLEMVLSRSSRKQSGRLKQTGKWENVI